MKILIEATKEMEFFQNMCNNKSSKEINLHLNLCRAMQFQFVPKGKIVFY